MLMSVKFCGSNHLYVEGITATCPTQVAACLACWYRLHMRQSGPAGGLQKIDRSLLGKVPLSYFLGVLGMPGMTAYTSLKKIAGGRLDRTAACRYSLWQHSISVRNEPHRAHSV